MPQANTIQTNFTSGEISPKMYGRVDINRYFNGAKTIKNFIVQPQGGVLARSGTRYVNGTKTNTKKSRLIPFQFSSTQAYVLEFGDFYMRIYKDGAIVTSGGPAVEVTTPYGENDLAALSWTQSADVLYLAHPSYRPRKITRTSHTSWSIAEFSRSEGPWGIHITDADKQLFLTLTSSDIRVYCASDPGAAVGKILHTKLDGVNTPLYVKTKTSATQYECSEIAFKPTDDSVITSPGGTTTDVHVSQAGYFDNTFLNWWFPISDSVEYYTKFQAHSGIDATTTDWSTITNHNSKLAIPTYNANRKKTYTVKSQGSTPFVSGDVGRYMKFGFSDCQFVGKVSAYTSSSQVTVEVTNEQCKYAKWSPLDGDQISDYGNTTWWAWEAWDSTNGFPTAVCFHEQRLCFGNIVTRPQTIWMSGTSDYENFEIAEPDNSVIATSAIEVTIASNTAEPIIWMTSGPVLLIGTQGGEFQFKATQISEPITPTNFTITSQTAFGSQLYHRGMRSGAATLFIQRAGRKIRELTYSFEIDAFLAKDVSILSSHIFSSSGANFCVQQLEPNITCWFLLGDGTLAAMTYERDQEVVAWHRHSLGGNGVIESIAVIPSSDLSYDTLYMIVRRTIGGATKRYVERLETDFPVSGGAVVDAFMLDCGLSYNGAPATTITGLSHLEGEVVHVLADGLYIGTKTVSSGQFTLSVAASKVHAGYLPDYTIETLPNEGGSAFGTSQGKIKRIHKIGIKFVNAIKYSYGRNVSNLYSKTLNSGALFTGDESASYEGTYSMDGVVMIKNPEPFPMSIIAIMPQLVTHE